MTPRHIVEQLDLDSARVVAGLIEGILDRVYERILELSEPSDDADGFDDDLPWWLADAE